MGWLRNVVRGDPKCGRCGRVQAACICQMNEKRALARKAPRERSRAQTPARQAQQKGRPQKFGR